MRKTFFLPLLFFVASLSVPVPARGGKPPLPARARLHLPLAGACFVPNRGQWRNPSLFAADFGGTRLFLMEGRWILASRRGSLLFRFEGSRPSAEIRPGKKLQGVYNYFLGSDPARWRRGVPRFDSVRYRGLYPGTDLVFRSGKGRPAFDLFLEPGADLGAFSLGVRGARSLAVDSRGDLVLDTPCGRLRLTRPFAWECPPGGERRPLPCRWILKGPRTAGLAAPERDPSLAMLVDPDVRGMVFGTNGSQKVQAVTFLDLKAYCATGWTDSPDFPTSPGSWDRTQNGDQDAFVTVLTASNQVLWTTFLGGSGQDRAWAVTLTAGKDIAIGGETTSPDFPTLPWAFDRKPGSKELGKAFLSALDPSGTTLNFSTYLGGRGMDCIRGLAARDKTILAAGFTNSPDFPTTGKAFQKKLSGGFDIFFTGFTEDKPAPLYSTLWGGKKDEIPQVLLLDQEGDALIAGATSSSTLPGSPIQPKPRGGFDALFLELSPRGEKVLTATRLGGNKDDQALAMTLSRGKENLLFLGGRTASLDFPATPNAFSDVYRACYETGWVACLKRKTTSLRWATFLGGRHRDFVSGLALDSKGRIWVAGGTESADFLDKPGISHHGGNDLFLVALDHKGEGLYYSTLLGGARDDIPAAFAFQPKSGFVIGGWTWSLLITHIQFPGGKMEDGPWGFTAFVSIPKI